MIAFLQLILGIALLIGGGTLLVRGASELVWTSVFIIVAIPNWQD